MNKKTITISGFSMLELIVAVTILRIVRVLEDGIHTARIKTRVVAGRVKS
jgi:hypothetical protein